MERYPVRAPQKHGSSQYPRCLPIYYDDGEANQLIRIDDIVVTKVPPRLQVRRLEKPRKSQARRLSYSAGHGLSVTRPSRRPRL